MGEDKVLRSMVLMTDGTHETGDADELEAESLAALAETDVDSLSPRAALDLIYRLRAMLPEE